MEETTLAMIQAKENGELRDMYTRMDVDRDAVYLNAYTLTGLGQFKDKEIPNTVSVTMNDPAVFANAVISVMQGAKRQTTIEGLSGTACKTIENFIDDLLYSIDMTLRKRRIASLWVRQCSRIAIRGPIGARVAFDANGKPKCLPVDIRYCPFEGGPEELEWVANHTFRNPFWIKKEYGIDVADKSTTFGIDVYDFWNSKVNEIWIAGNKVETKADGTPAGGKNPWGFVPFVIVYPEAGFGLEDADCQAHEAESIFFLVRNLYPEWNRLMSLQHTKALELIRPPVAHEVTNPGGPQQPYPFKVGENTPYLPGEEPHVLSTPDINRSFQGAEVQMGLAIHKGSPSLSDLSETSGERNAQWITQQTEIREKILFPRLQGLEMFYQEFAAMAIKEYLILLDSGRELAPLGRNETKRAYTKDDLGDPDSYTIGFKYMPDNQRQQLANYSVGLALKGELSRDSRFRDIYQLDDPDGEMDKLAVEEAEQSDQVVFFRNLSKRLIKQAKKKTGDEKKELCIEASIMADNMVEAIKKRKLASVGNQELTQGTERLQLPQGKTQGLLALPSLMGGGGTRQPQGVTNAG